MNLDFTKLNGLGQHESTQKAQEGPRSSHPENPAPARSDAPVGDPGTDRGTVALQLQADEWKAEVDRARQIYARYQEATRKTEELQEAIMRGMKEGKPLPDLFLQSMEAISLMTGNTAILTQARQDITAYRDPDMLPE